MKKKSLKSKCDEVIYILCSKTHHKLDALTDRGGDR